MYSWVRVLLALGCAAGAWYWLYAAEPAPESADAAVSTPSPERDEPPRGPDANAMRRPGGR
jgi:alpha-1,6-mannosyltransferase